VIGEVPARLAALAEADPRKPAVRALRGVRGVAMGDVARTAAEVWRSGVTLDRDAADLDTLFSAAFEDGLVAVGLLAAAADQDRDAAHELALSWAERTDDVVTADAIGWLVLAQTVLVGADLDATLATLAAHFRPETRRAGVTMALGFTPLEVEGAAAAPLREKVAERHVRLVDAADDARVAAVADRFVRDAAPPVQKALRRVLSAWAATSPEACASWSARVKGGLPKLLRSALPPRGR
jgi:hypothetical protein